MVALPAVETRKLCHLIILLKEVNACRDNLYQLILLPDILQVVDSAVSASVTSWALSTQCPML